MGGKGFQVVLVIQIAHYAVGIHIAHLDVGGRCDFELGSRQVLEETHILGEGIIVNTFEATISWSAEEDDRGRCG